MTGWVKSSHSFSNGNCVEVRAAGQHGEWVMVRDSKDPAGPQLAFTAADWVAFLRGVNAGEFDRIGAPQ